MRYFSSTVTRFDSVGCAVITGRMRKFDEQLLDLFRADAVRARLGEHVAKVPRSFSRPRVALDMAAPPHGSVLLGDGEQLKPDALGLQRAAISSGVKLGDIGAALQIGSISG